MADKRLTELAVATPANGSDLLYLLQDPSGASLDAQISVSNLFSSIVQSFNTRIGAVTLLSSDLNGLSGAGLTGIGTGTGGVINTGSTTIGADSDSDGIGALALQTQGVNRALYNPDGSVQHFVDTFDIQ